jgi:hypothetical protein
MQCVVRDQIRNQDKKENRFMKKITVASLMVFVFALTVFADDKVKDFTLKTIDGGTITNSSVRGPLVVNVAADW